VVEPEGDPEPAITVTWLDAPPSQDSSRKRKGSDRAALNVEPWENGKLNLYKVHGAATVVTVPAAAVVFSFRSQGNWKWKIPQGILLDKVMTLIKILEDGRLEQARDVAGQGGDDADAYIVSDEEDGDVIDAQAEEEPLLFLEVDEVE
jgi:hypothetical protein